MKRELCECPLILPYTCNNKAVYEINNGGFNVRICEGHLHIIVDMYLEKMGKNIGVVVRGI